MWPLKQTNTRKPIEVKVTNVYTRLRNAKEFIVINIGGARSSKSHSIAQRIVELFWNGTNKKILVTRKTGPALFLTAYQLILELLSQYGMYQRVQHNKTHNFIINPFTGSKIVFVAIDDPEKIKSTEWNYIWMEEANEFDWSDWLILQTRTSAPTTIQEPNQIFLSINPTEENGWINQRLMLSPRFSKKIKIIWSSYLDNPFLDQAYIDNLLELKHQDEAAFQIYVKGIWGVLKDFIYKPYTILETYPESFDETIYGLDFGFNNPTALLELNLKDAKYVYLEEKMYQTKLTNSALIELLKDIIPENHRQRCIYADSAEPARIEEILQEGFNIHPAIKVVKDGIDFCKRFVYYTTTSNVNLNKERGLYRWKTNKAGELLDEPVKFMDHLMDAKRYALYTHLKGNPEPTISVF